MLSISVISYNNEHVIQKTLDSILEHLPENSSTQLFLIDNKSEDKTPVILSNYASIDDRIKYIQNGRNIGYGAGHNLAIQDTDSQYHVICNPDIFFHNDVFSSLASFMNQNPKIGILCPRFRYLDGRLQPLNRRYPTVSDLLLRRFLPKSLKSLFQKRLNRYVMLDVGYDSVYDVPFVSGAFMFCRTDVLKQINGFDQRYFLYFEDVDLSRRMQQHGYRTVYYPYVEVTHGYERGSHKSLYLTLVFIASAFKYFNKWDYKFF